MQQDHTQALQAIKEQIWALCKQSLVNVQVAADKAKVTLPITTIAQGEAVVRVLKKRKKKVKVVIIPEEIKQRYRDAKYEYESKEFKHWVKDGHFIEPEFPDTTTKKGLDDFVVNFLTWSGHFANPTNNKGFPIEKNGKKVFIKSGSKRGMQDIDATLKHPDHPFGIPWKIETKTANDYQSGRQEKFEAKVNATAGVYSLVWGAEDFLSQYDRLMMVKPKQVSIFE